jgi:DDE family transposase
MLKVLKLTAERTSLMPKCTQAELSFPSFDRRKIEASFEGGDVSSDGGVLLLREADRRLGLVEAFDAVLPDPRHPLFIEHRQVDLLRQRIFGLALGYEDLNDHDTLRKDLAWQTALERDRELASDSTLCRLEQRVDRKAAVAFHQVLIEKFIASFKEAPTELILDFDATDDRVHGNQEGRHFHGYYGDWCFLPLYVFCGEQLLVSYLRPSNIDASRHAWAILKLLVQRLREQWPQVKIIVRADSGFCRWKMLHWCEWASVDYIIGLAKNSRLEALSQPLMEEAKQVFATTQEKQRHFGWVDYAAATWDRERRVIAKAEYTEKGENPRYVVTSLEGDAQDLYDKVYCARGEMENRIKEQQLGLFSDRTSSHGWWSNQFRVLLSAAAYVLMETIRRVGLKGTELARAQVGTIRLKLLKIGTVIIRNTRRIRLLFSSAYPHQNLFKHVCTALGSS